MITLLKSADLPDLVTRSCLHPWCSQLHLVLYMAGIYAVALPVGVHVSTVAGMMSAVVSSLLLMFLRVRQTRVQVFDDAAIRRCGWALAADGVAIGTVCTAGVELAARAVPIAEVLVCAVFGGGALTGRWWAHWQVKNVEVLPPQEASDTP